MSPLNSLSVSLSRKLDFPAPASPAKTRRYIGAGSSGPSMLASNVFGNATKHTCQTIFCEKSSVCYKENKQNVFRWRCMITLKLCSLSKTHRSSLLFYRSFPSHPSVFIRLSHDLSSILHGALKSHCTVPLRKMQTNVFVEMMQSSLSRWEPSTPQLQISFPISVTDRVHTHLKSSRLSTAYLHQRGPLSRPDARSDLHIRRDTRVTVVHRFQRASAIVAVVVAARALGRVHRQRDAAVQVLISPVGNVRVGAFAGIPLRAASTDTLALAATMSFKERSTDSQKCVQISYVPAVVECALSEGLHPPGRDFILGRQLLSRLGKSGRKLFSLGKAIYCEFLFDVDPVGMSKYVISKQRTHPPFSCNRFTGQRRAQPVVTVVQLFVCFPNDVFKEIQNWVLFGKHVGRTMQGVKFVYNLDGILQTGQRRARKHLHQKKDHTSIHKPN